MNEFICDCGDQHRDNPFCYDRHLKYNRVIRSDAGILDAAVAENILTRSEADSMLVTAKLSRAGRMTMLHRSIFHSYLDRLDPVIERLREIGYAV